MILFNGHSISYDDGLEIFCFLDEKFQPVKETETLFFEQIFVFQQLDLFFCFSIIALKQSIVLNDINQLLMIKSQQSQFNINIVNQSQKDKINIVDLLMGNQCCSDDTVLTTEMLTSGAMPNSKDDKKIDQSQNKISYIDSEGNPLPNAYKRYVKPPTTVGRQSLIVRDLHEHDEVPDWIWAFDNNILSSNHNKGLQKNIKNNSNRKTFQQIQGRFKGVQTVNLSKLQFQPQNMTGSHNVTGFNRMQANENNIRYTVQPSPIIRSISECNKPVMQGQGNYMMINPIDPIKKTFSAQEVPIIASVNYSHSIPQNSPFPPSIQSVNNSIQQSPVKPQMSVIKY